MRQVKANSYGGVVLRSCGIGQYEVDICGRSVNGTWRLPKDTPDPGESAEATACREVQEETGLAVAIIDNIDAAVLSLDTVGVGHRLTFIQEQPAFP